MKKVRFITAFLALFIIANLNTTAQTGSEKKCRSFMNAPAFSSFEEIPYPFVIEKVSLNPEVELAYVDEGSGRETIIFIHGLGSYLPAWKKNIEELRNDYRCIAVDLPGYGKSSKLPHDGSMTFYAGIISQFIDKLNLGKVIIAGHSMGGQIAMVMALYHPEKVKALILAAPAGFETFTEGQKQWFRNVMTLDGVKKTTADDIQTNLAWNFYNLPADAEFMITDRLAMRSASDFEAYCHAVVQSVNGMVNEPVLSFLDKIQQPVLILFGENDNLIPNRFLNPGPTRKIGEKGASLIPNSKLVMLPKTGHFVQFEGYAEFNKRVRDFVSGL